MSTLFKNLKKFSKKDKIRFHVPGHNGGELYGSDFTKNMFKTDVTEFEETDDLQRPSSILLKAQKNAEEIFGSKKTFYLTCGSTIGIQAMITGVFDKGDRIIVDRNCHKSVISALIIGGINPLFVYPRFNPENSIYLPITSAQIEEVLNENPDVKGAVITSPTYYGITSDIKQISELLHSKGKFLLVDEAHGADFVFSDKLPKTALECGADVCIQSVHKTLPCLTQTSLMHVGKKSKISIPKLERALRLLHTTSPSYLLMSSIDEGVHIMKKSGKNRIAALVDRLESFETKLSIVGRIETINKSVLAADMDKSVLRLVLNFKKLGISGFKAAEILKKDYGIYAETADFFNVVFVITASNTVREIDLLESAIEEISVSEFLTNDCIGYAPNVPKIELVCDPSSAFSKPFETLPIKSDKLLNRISANIYSVCPPGFAILIPGQKINAETLQYIRKFTDFESIDILSE